MGKSTDMESLYVHEKRNLFLSGYVDDFKMVGKRLQKDIDLEDPTPWIDRVYLGCTQRQAKMNHQGVQSKAELNKKLTTTGETVEESSVIREFMDVSVWFGRR